MSVEHLPWESVPGPIYHPRELRPRKKWVTAGGWCLSGLLILGGMITPYRVLAVFGVLYILSLLMEKDTAITRRGIEIYYQMRITTHYDFLGWDKVETVLCEDRKHAELVAVHFVYGDRVKRLFFTKAEAEQVIALAIEQNPKIVRKQDEKKDQQTSSPQLSRKKKRQ